MGAPLCAPLRAGVGAGFGLELVDIPVLPNVVLGFVSLYVLMVEMRVLGLMFRSYRERLGWLG